MKPFDYQIPEITSMVESLRDHKIHANTSCTGSGKTVMTCMAAKELGLDLCVLCPKIVIDSWLKTARSCGVRVHWVRNYENVLAKSKRSDGLDYDEAPFRWRDPEKPELGGRWWIPRRTLLVMDEAHRLSGFSSATSKLLFAAKRGKIPTLLLSATLADSPAKLNAIGFALGLHRGGYDFECWAQRNGLIRTEYGWGFTGGSSILSQIREQCAGKISGLTPNQIPDLPENRIQTLSLPADEPVDEVYFKTLEMLELYAEDPLPMLMRARQKAEHLKLAPLAEHVRLAHKEGAAPVVFVNFIDSGERLESLLKDLGTKFLCGTTPKQDRVEILEDFQRGYLECLVLQMETGGVGIDLHNVHGVRPRISFINPGWSALHFIQALGRTRRVGSVDQTVIQKICYAEGSEIEEKVASAIRAKIECIDALNDDDLRISE